MKIDKKKFKEEIIQKLKMRFGKTLENASKREIFDATCYATMMYIGDNWVETRETYEKSNVKQAYYLSAEYLMGRALGNNLVNLLIQEDVAAVLKDIGFDYNEIEDTEFDAGLGNGGLGRLAACFLDSLATLELPGHGYGIRYRYGMFEQKIINGYQVEYPDRWLRFGDPWSIRCDDDAVDVHFGGHVEIIPDEKGRSHFNMVDSEVIRATPYDTPVVGFGVKTVNTLRLWDANSPEDFDLQLFNDGQYLKAVEKANIAKDISRVLYPNDHTEPGKRLRLRQQYFFVSASLQDLIRKYKKRHGDDFTKFSDEIAIQMNDTHPVVAVPELMRLLMDVQGMEWDEAWGIMNKTCAFTNHTIMIEALEKWDVTLFCNLLPRIYQIIEEINRRLTDKLRKKYPNDYARHQRMAIIGNGVINMAALAIEGGHKVNGVAALHTDILKQDTLKDWFELYPEKFCNKTNGVTQRRWLLKSNPELAKLINEKIGGEWITDMSKLKKLEEFADDKDFRKKFWDIKLDSKKRLAEYIKRNNGIIVDPESIFDVQVKRLHEYKRQLLNVMHIMYLYNKIKANPKIDIHPRTFIFSAKAASGYRRAKLIIKLINSVAEKINNDPTVNGKLKVVFLANYRVSLAEMIFPASDVSEQISTAGKEASGTGNMKFMMNGALTLGTMDGANIEIVEEAGQDNAFIFGLLAEEVAKLNDNGYNPWEIYNANAELHKVIDQLVDGTYNPREGHEIFRELYDYLMNGVDGNRADQYYVLKDFAEYVKAQEKIDKNFRDKDSWIKKAIINVARSGRFSSDRTILEYAKEIWNIKKTPVK